MENSQDSNNKILAFLNQGADITGSIIGSFSGYLLGGAEGVLASSVAIPYFTNFLRIVINDVNAKHLTPREEVRIASVMLYALERLKALMDEESWKEKDEYFILDEQDQERSIALEQIEGTIRAAKDEFEERKIKYLGNLYAHIVFNQIPLEKGNALIRIVNELSFRQLCILSLLVREYPLALTAQEIEIQKNKHGAEVEELTLVSEIKDLQRRGLVVYTGTYPNFEKAATTINTRFLLPSHFSREFARLTYIQEIDNSDLTRLNNDLMISVLF